MSNSSQARLGATYAPWEFVGDWNVVDATGKRGRVELGTALRGTCDPRALLDLFENLVALINQERFDRGVAQRDVVRAFRIAHGASRPGSRPRR